jgi:hypothetical protein
MNNELHNEIISYLKPKTIFFTNSKDWVGQSIIECQDIYVQERYNYPSQWSHVGFIGIDGRTYESTISFSWTKFVNGIVISTPEKWFSKKELKNYNKIGFQYDFTGLSDKDWGNATEYGKLLKKDNYQYGIFELFGTFWYILKWKVASEKGRKKLMQEKNIFDDPKSVYCSAFVSDCLEKKSNINYIDVEHSISTVDDCWHTPLKHKKKIFEL